MTTTAAGAGMPTGSLHSIQAPFQHTDDNRKRPRPKNVTWASEDKLHQVRLFAAEDAPSISGSVLQDLLEAKKTKFMHALVPVAGDDLPPGFEGVATKRARLDSAAILAMVAQITWRFPERFCFDPSWQVALGDENSEAKVQRQRELRVLEAIYPRPSAVPSSSLEPHEIPTGDEDSEVLEIPLIPTEDEDEGPEENDLPGGTESSKSVSYPSNDLASGTEASSTYPPGYSPLKDAQNLTLKRQSKGGSSSAAAQFNSDLTSTFLKSADPDVAAAAAAAYAVVKAKENGALIDHELLIKILSNPLLIESLTASNPSLRKQFGDISSSSRGSANGIKSEQSRLEGSLLVPVSHTNPFHVQGRQRGYLMPGAHDMLVGQARGAYANNIGPPGRQYPILHQDSRELAQQLGMPGMIMNDAQMRPSAPPVPFDEGMLGHDSERYWLGRPWLGTNSSALPLVGVARNNVAPQDRPSATKIRKQCFFFNTPRGCRNGIYCNFAHDSAPEKQVGERVPNDVGQEMKFPMARGDSASDEETK
ncbi:hypothetical protein GOP47_0024300 [Adiantum capillus-veneris]|uniref:C3H1-type domain-containing protein n=1 Tax=Adiantum capillus-veneris TaxID=13818 RepID=A0A9D4U2R6_ADICA|nr:hypothetical protein GOP47_0024300 [Adiantum capillus-veneris]